MPSRPVTKPVYQQLSARLREMIAKKAFAPDQKFLTEREISGRFHVSRATANKAVSNLVAEGILAFRKGVGTFVREGLLNYDLAHLVSFTDKARAARVKPSTRVLRLKTIRAADAPEAIRSKLRVGADDSLYEMERLRLADGSPVILERRWVVARHCPRLSARDLDGSLYRLWSKKYSLQIAGADQTIRAVGLAQQEAKLLGVSPRSPGLLVESVGFMKGETPLWYERTLYRGDRYEFHNRLGPLSASAPAVGKIIQERSL